MRYELLHEIECTNCDYAARVIIRPGRETFILSDPILPCPNCGLENTIKISKKKTITCDVEIVDYQV